MANIVRKNAQGYGYKYTDLAEIHNYLEGINSQYIQKVERIDGDDYIFTKRCFDGKWDEEWLQGSRVVQATLSGIKNPAQEQGSALTYARRYSLLLAYGLATDDDDGAALTQKPSDKIDTTQIQALEMFIKKQNIDRNALESILSQFDAKEIKDINKKDLSSVSQALRKLA